MNLHEKYSAPVPRYTSYPTALQFHSGIDSATVTDWLTTACGTTSIYIHMAYCKALCLYCGCNMKVTNKAETITAYTNAVLKEMDMVAAKLPRRPDVASIHLGGGTPSYAPLPDIKRLFTKIRSFTDVRPDAEISMEIDPRQLPDDLPPLMGKLGFNRASLGIQDTNPQVQEAIRRVQPHALNLRAVQLLRRAGVEDINVDLLYGLPFQTTETIRQTVKDVLALDPARISLFGYAHVPWMKKHQLVLEQHGLPDQPERMQLFQAAADALNSAGYLTIGFDHFCKPEDPMAKALTSGKLHRNFMGFTTDEAPLLLGFGASAISQYPQGYAQNLNTPSEYTAAITYGLLPTARGVRVTEDDAIRRDIIESLLCNMRTVGHTGQGCKLSLQSLIFTPSRLQEAIQDGLVEWRDDNLHITPKGRPFARHIASCFDTYHTPTNRHSRL